MLGRNVVQSGPEAWGLPQDRLSRRARAVAGLEIVGTPPEERFDRITRMARLMFRAPIATITIFDGDTAWFKSADGFDGRQAPLSQVFCSTTADTGERLIVENAAEDRRFRNLPGVTGKAHVRFYAGEPLVDRHGEVVGSFCVYDDRPRVFRPDELELFQELAAWAQAELIERTDLARAKEVQEALLPGRTPHMPGYELAATCTPSFNVGGDYYDWARTDYGTALGVADVMGKGSAAAIMGATVRAALRTASELTERDRDGRYRLDKVMSGLARIVTGDLLRTNIFVTVFLAHLEESTGRVDFADAGHGFCLVVAPDGGFRRISGTDLPLGIEPRGSWGQGSFTLAPSETMLIFSDGLFDLFGGADDALRHIALLATEHPDPNDLVDTIAGLATAATAVDDVTAIVVRRQA